MPELGEADMKVLSALITLELQAAVATFPNAKALGSDGLPIKIYKTTGAAYHNIW